MLVLGGIAPTVASGEERLQRAIADGSGLARFQALVERQGGDARALDAPERLLGRLETREVRARSEGWVTAIDTEALGLAAVVLGAGRIRADAPIDAGVGFTVLRTVGDAVAPGEPLLRIQHRAGTDVGEVVERVLHAYRIGPEPVARPTLFLERMEAAP